MVIKNKSALGKFAYAGFGKMGEDFPLLYIWDEIGYNT